MCRTLNLGCRAMYLQCTLVEQGSDNNLLPHNYYNRTCPQLRYALLRLSITKRLVTDKARL